MGHKRTLARCIIWAWRNFYLGNTYERIGIVMFDIRVDAGRHSPRHIAAPCVAQTSSQQRLPDVVRLGVGLIATIAALVLGLLIASAKSSFDTQSTQITQITADIILLDNLLAEYGPEARPIREQMRSIIGPLADRLWREKQASAVTPFELSASAENAFWRSRRCPRRTTSSAPFKAVRHSSAPIWCKPVSSYLRSRPT